MPLVSGGFDWVWAPKGIFGAQTQMAATAARKEAQSTEPAGTIHSHDCPVTAAIRSKSAS